MSRLHTVIAIILGCTLAACASAPLPAAAPAPTSPDVSDRAAVAAWFSARDAGTPPLPERLYVDGEPASPSRFLAFLDHASFDFGPCSFAAVEPWGAPDAVRALVPDACPHLGPTSAGGVDTSYEHILFMLDASSRIVAIDIGASG